MTKKVLPPIQCLEFQRDSSTNLVRAIFAAFIAIIFFVFGFFLYNFTLPYLKDHPYLTTFLILLYIPFELFIMFFSVYFIDQIELLFRRIKD